MDFVDAAGVRIGYRRVGRGPLLVFVHGAAEDGRVWGSQCADLADEFTVVAWDAPGAGRSSDLPEDFGLAGIADGLAALIQALRLGPAHVAGQSFGGTVVLELYRRHPELVGTLILIDTYAGWKGSLPASEVQARVGNVRQMLAAPSAEFNPALPGLFAGDPPAMIMRLLDATTADVRPTTLAQQLDIMANADLNDVLPDIAVPTLLIWGRQDVRSPLTVARQFEAAIPDATLVMIENAGHMASLEQPALVNSAIRQFCRAHPPANPT